MSPRRHVVAKAGVPYRGSGSFAGLVAPPPPRSAGAGTRLHRAVPSTVYYRSWSRSSPIRHLRGSPLGSSVIEAAHSYICLQQAPDESTGIAHSPSTERSIAPVDLYIKACLYLLLPRKRLASTYYSLGTSCLSKRQ